MTEHPRFVFSAALPPEAPLAMPVQDLSARPPGRAGSDRAGAFARAAILAATGALCAWFIAEMHAVLSLGGLTVIEMAMLALFSLNIAWIAFAFTLAAGGCLVLIARRMRAIWRPEREGAPGGLPAHLRTALLLPTYNEDPARVFGTALATAEALADAGAQDAFDIFVLSDTTDPDIWIAEEAAFLALEQETRARAKIFYRRRPLNVERKAGNIGEWVRRFGGAYPFFIVFDADSLMSARTLIRLVQRMHADPRLGLLQTVPTLMGRSSLFARVQQFASRVYGPVLSTGLALWSGKSGNFWGHNAILRTRAFADHAGLPHLPGKPPFGGHILSHDFVEAALMRRAGWDIVIDPSLGGSYEESPPSLIDLAVRDRRWCQGNLQHARVIGARGLHWVSRVHLGIGIMAYLAAPIWLAFLIAGLALALQAHFVRPEYFPHEFNLFPVWPVIDFERALGLFAFTMAIVFAPKLMSLAVLLATPRLRRGTGGGLRASAGILVETFISALLAPVMMAIQSAAVFQILIGRDSGWNPQRRDDGSLPWSEIARRHRGHTLLGVALAMSAYAVSPHVFLWMSPAIIGLLLAVPVSAITAARAPMLRRLGILLIPEETIRPSILLRARDAQGRIAPALGAERDGLARLVEDERLLSLHRALLPPPAPRPRGSVDAALVVGLARLDAFDDLAEAASVLERREKLALLGHRDGIARIERYADQHRFPRADAA